MTRWIEASISILKCNQSDHTTPHITFCGDTDMVTAGLASLSSVITDEIVVAELKPAELTDETGKDFETRINELLGRDDLRFIRLSCVEAGPAPAGRSFQDFRNAYTAPRLIFACPRCDGGEAVSTKTEAPSDFQRAGGKLTVLTAVELRD